MRGCIESSVAELLGRARADGREMLLDTEGYALVESIGIRAPRHLMVSCAAQAASADIASLGGDRIVVKVVSPGIPHRSEVGGVAIVPAERDAVMAAVGGMEERCRGRAVAGFTLNEFVPHDVSLGGELLLGARWTDDFGPVVTFGPGGIYTERLAESLREDRGAAILSPSLTPNGRLEEILEHRAVTPMITGRLRGQEPLIEPERLVEMLSRFLAFSGTMADEGILEFEINPLAFCRGGPVALDVLVRLGRPAARPDPDRPLWKLRALLEPRSIAIIGVSEKMNPGRVILRNILRDGFDPDQIHVVKPGRDFIDGCRCWPGLAFLPGKVDLLVLSVEASQAPALVEEVIRERRAESLIVIPGGLGERAGTEALQAKMRAALLSSRAEEWGGPLINGGNCLGIRSRPGRYDTMFIPGYKFASPIGPVTPLAIVSQSGAFAIARASKLGGLNPRYLISIGNQADLTMGDYLTWLKDDEAIQVYACYVEGFRPLDGRRWLEAAAAIAAGGRTVILYRAGRTAAGGRAAASHTASIAGDYAVTRELCRAAGVVVADTHADFEDLIRMFCQLGPRRARGMNLGAMSNAGFECVAMADNLQSFRLPDLGENTRRRLEDLFRRCRLHGIVEPRNPLDVTPIMDDEGFEEAARALLEDPVVDAAVIGVVPMTPALHTLAPTPGHSEDVGTARSIAGRLARLREVSPKPWVAVVDGGALYDPMALMLEGSGVPVFRSADRALKLFEVYCRARMAA